MNRRTTTESRRTRSRRLRFLRDSVVKTWPKTGSRSCGLTCRKSFCGPKRARTTTMATDAKRLAPKRPEIWPHVRKVQLSFYRAKHLISTTVFARQTCATAVRFLATLNSIDLLYSDGQVRVKRYEGTKSLERDSWHSNSGNIVYLAIATNKLGRALAGLGPSFVPLSGVQLMPSSLSRMAKSCSSIVPSPFTSGFSGTD